MAEVGQDLTQLLVKRKSQILQALTGGNRAQVQQQQTMSMESWWTAYTPTGWRWSASLPSAIHSRAATSTWSSALRNLSCC